MKVILLIPKELVAMEWVAEGLANRIVCCSLIPLFKSTLGDFELCWKDAGILSRETHIIIFTKR